MKKEEKNTLLKLIDDQIAKNKDTSSVLESIIDPLKNLNSEIKLFQNQKIFKKKLSQVESSVIEELFEVKKRTSITFYDLYNNLKISKESLLAT